MRDIDPVIISGSGKYVLLLVKDSPESLGQMILRGGTEFNMHKDIVKATEVELGGFLILPQGGGVLNFFDRTNPKQIVLSGESIKYGPVVSPKTVANLIQEKYPEYHIEALG